MVNQADQALMASQDKLAIQENPENKEIKAHKAQQVLDLLYFCCFSTFFLFISL